MKTFSITPLGDRVIVQRLPEEEDFLTTTEGVKLVKPETAREKMLIGVVLSLSPRRPEFWESFARWVIGSVSGLVRAFRWVEPEAFDLYVSRETLTVGTHVFFGRYAGIEIDEHFGKDLLMMRYDEIQAVVNISDDGVEEPTEEPVAETTPAN